MVLLPRQIVLLPVTLAVGLATLVTVLVQVLVHPLALVSVSVKVKVFDPPAVTLTEEVLVAPTMVPLPLMDQR